MEILGSSRDPSWKEILPKEKARGLSPPRPHPRPSPQAPKRSRQLGEVEKLCGTAFLPAGLSLRTRRSAEQERLLRGPAVSTAPHPHNPVSFPLLSFKLDALATTSYLLWLPRVHVYKQHFQNSEWQLKACKAFWTSTGPVGPRRNPSGYRPSLSVLEGFVERVLRGGGFSSKITKVNPDVCRMPRSQPYPGCCSHTVLTRRQDCSGAIPGPCGLGSFPVA